MNPEGLSLAGHTQENRLPCTSMHVYPQNVSWAPRLPLQSSQPYIAHPEEPTLNKQTAQTHRGCSAGATSVGKPNPFPQSQQTKQPGP